MLSYLIDGNGYETRQTSKGLTKEQTLILSRTSTLHNHLFYSRLIDQIETFSLAHYPICAETFLFSVRRVTVEKSEQKDRTMGFITY